MHLGEEIKMFGLDRALIHFVENEGMAFGWKLEISQEQGYDYGKLLLSLFRICAVGFLIYYIRGLIKSTNPNGLIASFSLILAGALGNIIDSAFYGIIFSDSSFHSENIAQFFPAEGGYGSFLQGKVVDMFYFPLFEGVLPAWLPFGWGGEPFQFFRPVFNFADAAISVGVASLIIFQRAYFNEDEAPKAETAVVAEEIIEENVEAVEAVTETAIPDLKI